MITPSRKPNTAELKTLRKHAERVGAAVLAWNELHSHLYMIFWYVVGLDGHPMEDQMAPRIWHTIQSDKTQREMLGAAASVRLAKNQAALKHLEWILDRAEKLAPYRNLGAHTPVKIYRSTSDKIRPDRWSTAVKMVRRYSLIDHKKFWRLLAGDLYALSHYTEWLEHSLWRPERMQPSIRRPKLLSVPLIDEIASEIGRQVQSQAQARQQQAVQGKPQKGTKPKK